MPDVDDAELLRRPIAHDPRFGLEAWPGTPLLIDLVAEDLAAAGRPVDLRASLRRMGLEEALCEAETVGEYIAVLERAVADACDAP
jgi:hypothetical protein